MASYDQFSTTTVSPSTPAGTSLATTAPTRATPVVTRPARVEGTSPAATSPAPYSCSCGATSPYQGRRPRHKGGNACRQCSAVEKAIHAAHNAAMRAVSAEAYRNNLTGDAKAAVMKRAEQAGREAWNAARASYGVGPGWGDEPAPALAPQLPAYDPTIEVQVRYAAPDDFGLSAIGGTFEELHGAIVQEMRAMVAAGLIGPGELTDVGNSLLDIAQDAALARKAVA